MSQLVVLDNEAVQALRDPSHPKHLKVVSYVQSVTDRKRRAEVINAVVASIRNRTGVSLADAHARAVVTLASATAITVITSDPLDMREVAGDTKVTIVTI